MRIEELSFKSFSLLIAVAIVFIAATAAQSQTHEPGASGNSFSVSLGNQTIVLPAPEGFEEVSSKYESMKTLFEASEPPESDLLATFMTVSDIDLLKKGKAPDFKRYMKVSVSKAVRSAVLLSSDFADSVEYVRKNNAQIFSPDNSDIKKGLAKQDQVMSKEANKDVSVKYTQNTNLGDFDNRPNVYSNLMMMFYKAQVDGKEIPFPVLAAITFMHVKNRIILVTTFKRYDSEPDKDELRQFTTKWINQILAAN